MRRGAIRYDELEETLLVTWLEAGDLGASPLARYRALLVGRDEGPRLELALARLAGLAESLPEAAAETGTGAEAEADQPSEP